MEESNVRISVRNKTNSGLSTLPYLSAVCAVSNIGPEHSHKRRFRSFLLYNTFQLCELPNFLSQSLRHHYTIYPGEWVCRIQELMLWFRTRIPRQALSILKNLQERHLITFEILGHGKLIKYRIIDWHNHNRVLEYNAPCQKDTGFFFLPISKVSEIIGTRRPSEMDVLLDLWVNTVYNDEQVQSSEVCPVVYMRNGSGNPLISYASLSQQLAYVKGNCRDDI